MFANIASLLLAMSKPGSKAKTMDKTRCLNVDQYYTPILMNIAYRARAFARMKERLIGLLWRAAYPTCI
jgi:hypothetical protein